MYCSYCGVDSVEGLKYCKRCGANLGADTPPPKKLPVALILAFLVFIGGVFTLGVTVPTLIAHEFSSLGFSHREVMVLCVADIGLTLLVIAMLGWLLLRLAGVHSGGPVRVVEIAPREILQPQISAPPQSVGSVTENTTRTLDKRKYDTPASLR